MLFYFVNSFTKIFLMLIYIYISTKFQNTNKWINSTINLYKIDKIKESKNINKKYFNYFEIVYFA